LAGEYHPVPHEREAALFHLHMNVHSRSRLEESDILMNRICFHSHLVFQDERTKSAVFQFPHGNNIFNSPGWPVRIEGNPRISGSKNSQNTCCGNRSGILQDSDNAFFYMPGLNDGISS
jgi:hypothetical protein